jgi:dipeptidyl aminopeptidase/acylaminoacyl peptidase
VDLGPTPDRSSVVTDPESDVYVHTEERGGGLVVVVRSLESGEIVQEVPAVEQFGRNGGRAGLSYDDGTVYLGVNRQGVFALDLDTEEIIPLGFETSGLPAVREGHAVVGDRDTFRVVDVATGDAALTVPAGRLVNASLSPDARWLLVARDTTGTAGVPLAEDSPPEVTVYEVGSGTKTVLDPGDSGLDWAWTLTGDLYRIDGEDVVRCDPVDGACDRTPAPDPVPAYGNPAIPGTPPW